MALSLPPCRLEYDAYRTDLEELSMGPRDAGTLSRLDAAQSHFQSHKDKYEKLRADVAIKLKFLEENKVGASPRLQGGLWRFGFSGPFLVDLFLEAVFWGCIWESPFGAAF